MSAPKRWFLREYLLDPGDGPDDIVDKDMPSKEEALRRAKVLRTAGRVAGAFERTNMRAPNDDTNISWMFWEWDEKSLDEDGLAEAAELSPELNARKESGQ